METHPPPSLLIVDDDPSIRRFLSAICTAQSIPTIAVESAEAALEQLKVRSFDLILLDLQLNDANGFDLAEQIKTDYPHHNIPIIGMSGHFSTPENVARGFNLGFIDYILKPFTEIDFMARIQSRINLEWNRKKIDQDHQAAQKRALRQVESEQERFRALACNGFDLIIEFDAEGKPIYLSPNHASVLGWKVEEMSLSDFFLQIHDDDREKLKDSITKTGSDIISFQLQDKNQIYHRFEANRCRFHSELGDRILLICRDMTSQYENQERLKFLAMHDPLTKLLNRNSLDEVFRRYLREARRGKPCAVAFADLDRFKVLNDQLGHRAGDQVLQQVSSLMLSVLNSEDKLIRYAGDEFVVFLGNTPPEQIQERAEQIISKVRHYRYEHEEKQFSLNISMGAVPLDIHKKLEEVLSQADNACYSAKRLGGNRIERFDPQRNVFNVLKSDHTHLELLMEHLNSGKAEIWYQPIVHLESRRPIYYEALLRLHGCNGEIISPGALVASAERLNAAGELDMFVLSRVLEDINKYSWLSASINLSGQTLAMPNFEEWLVKMIEVLQVNPERISFEITETYLIQYLDEIKERLKRLRKLGLRFLLDDFGSGYSSLNYLREMPIDTLKIDRSFIEKIDDSDFDRVLLEFILRISNVAGIKTVVEGISQEEQRTMLLEMGFTRAQGFLFSKARPPTHWNEYFQNTLIQ